MTERGRIGVITLEAFLAARLGEDEAGARFVMEREARMEVPRADWLGHPFAERLLREVEAKHAILTEHAPGYPTTYPKPSGQPTCRVCHAGGWDWDPENWPCPTVRAVAGVYSDHPDYDPAWAPK